jgi:hypothetical protein
MDKKDLKRSKKHVPSFKMPFTPKSFLKGNLKYERMFLDVSTWKDMEERIHPKRKVLVSNLLHDREAVMLYSPTGVGKTWLSLAISLIAAGRGSLELLDWQNEDPQPVCYVDGEMLEEDIQERIKLLIPTLGVDQDLLRENFLCVSRVSQPDAIEDFLSLELDENQLELLKWVKNHTGNGKSPVIVLDNLSNLAELGDDNSAGHMQSFNMIVTKARKVGCSLVIVHHTGKTLNLGPDGVPTWRGSYDMATRLDKTICLLPCQSSMDGYVTFQVLEGKSRRGQRLNTSIQLNPYDRKWELYDESLADDRNQMITDLIEMDFISKLEDLKEIIGRSVSSAERYVKQAIDSGYLSSQDWKDSKQKAKNSEISKEERIKGAKEFLQENYEILRNDPGRNGRYVVQKKAFSFDTHSDF